MKTSLQGAMEIIAHEGIVTSRYLDSASVFTIGVGHTAAAGAPNPATFTGTMTVKDAIELFRRDLARYEAEVAKAFTVPLKQHEFDASVSFHFNCGAIHKATWVKQFNAGKRSEAIAGIMNWSKPKEIIGRRRKEQKLFSTGLYSGDGFATIYPATSSGVVQWAKGKRVNLRKAYGGIPTHPPAANDNAQPPAKHVPPVPAPEQPRTPEPIPAVPQGGFWAAVVAFLASIFQPSRK